MTKAWLLAAGVMLLGIPAFLAALAFGSYWVTLTPWFLVPFATAIVASSSAPRRQFNVGLLTFVPCGLVLFVTAEIASRYGLADSLDLTGTLVAFASSLPIVAASSAAGAFLGQQISRAISDRERR